MVICLERGADLHTAQLRPLPLTVSCFSKIQMILPFWYRLTWVVRKRAVKRVCVCVMRLIFVIPVTDARRIKRCLIIIIIVIC